MKVHVFTNPVTGETLETLHEDLHELGGKMRANAKSKGSSCPAWVGREHLFTGGVCREVAQDELKPWLLADAEIDPKLGDEELYPDLQKLDLPPRFWNVWNKNRVTQRASSAEGKRALVAIRDEFTATRDRPSEKSGLIPTYDRVLDVLDTRIENASEFDAATRRESIEDAYDARPATFAPPPAPPPARNPRPASESMGER